MFVTQGSSREDFRKRAKKLVLEAAELLDNTHLASLVSETEWSEDSGKASILKQIAKAL